MRDTEKEIERWKRKERKNKVESERKYRERIERETSGGRNTAPAVGRRTNDTHTARRERVRGGGGGGGSSLRRGGGWREMLQQPRRGKIENTCMNGHHSRLSMSNSLIVVMHVTDVEHGESHSQQQVPVVHD